MLYLFSSIVYKPLYATVMFLFKNAFYIEDAQYISTEAFH